MHFKLPTDAATFRLPVNTLIFRDGRPARGDREERRRSRSSRSRLGRDFGNTVEVVSGLTGTELVVVNPPDSLTDGQSGGRACRAGPAERRPQTVRTASALARRLCSLGADRGSACATLSGDASCRTPAPQVPPAFKENRPTGRPGSRPTSCGAAPGGRSSAIRSSTRWRRRSTCPTTRCAARRRGSSRRARRSASTRAARYPQVTTTPQIDDGHGVGQPHRRDGARARRSDFVLPIDVSYEADVWGRVRLGVASAARDGAQASAADLEAVRLSLHAELALDYFELRGIDAERAILDNSVAAFQRALELTRNRFAGGIASQADVALAETQLESTRAQAIDLGAGARRSSMRSPSLDGQAAVGAADCRRRRSRSAARDSDGAAVGSARAASRHRRAPNGASPRPAPRSASRSAAFFPRLLLTATAGFQSRSLAELAERPEHVLVGRTRRAAITLFDGGRRRAVSEQARAGTTRPVAVLPGDDPAIAAGGGGQPRHAARAARGSRTSRRRAVAAAERSVTLATNRYRGGVTSYLEVIAAQSAALYESARRPSRSCRAVSPPASS